MPITGIINGITFNSQADRGLCRILAAELKGLKRGQRSLKTYAITWRFPGGKVVRRPGKIGITGTPLRPWFNSPAQAGGLLRENKIVCLRFGSTILWAAEGFDERVAVFVEALRNSEVRVSHEQ